MNKNGDPRYYLLAALLKARGLKVSYNVRLNSKWNLNTPFKELNLTVPMIVSHANKPRRLVIAMGHSLGVWRERLRVRGIDLLLVSADGLVSNTDNIASMVCTRIYRLDPEDLKMMLAANMSLSAISKVTSLSETEVYDKIRFYFRVPIEEVCGQSSLRQ